MSCFCTFVFLLFIILIERSDGDDEDDPIYASQMSDTSSTTSQNGTTASPTSLHELPPPSPRPTAITVPFPPITPDRSNPEELNSGPIHRQDGSESGSVVEDDASCGSGSKEVVEHRDAVGSTGDEVRSQAEDSPDTRRFIEQFSPDHYNTTTATPTPTETETATTNDFTKLFWETQLEPRNLRQTNRRRKKKPKPKNSGGMPPSTLLSLVDGPPNDDSSVTFVEVDASSVATGVVVDAITGVTAAAYRNDVDASMMDQYHRWDGTDDNTADELAEPDASTSKKKKKTKWFHRLFKKFSS